MIQVITTIVVPTAHTDNHIDVAGRDKKVFYYPETILPLSIR